MMMDDGTELSKEEYGMVKRCGEQLTRTSRNKKRRYTRMYPFEIRDE